MNRHRFFYDLLSALVALLLVIPAASTLAATGTTQAQAPTAVPWIFHVTGSLDPGQSEDPTYPLFGQASRDINIKLVVTSPGAPGSLTLKYYDGSSSTDERFEGVALSGETLWTSTSLKLGANKFALENTSGPGGPRLTYNIWIYPLDTAPYTWAGQSKGDGTWRSDIRLNFPTSGLYTFTSTAAAGRYQFALDENHALETVESGGGSVSLYVPAGVRTLRILPDGTESTTTWSLAVSGPGAGADTLPYTATGGEIGGVGNPFAQEWIPLYLTGSAKANFALEVDGAAGDSLTVTIYTGTPPTPLETVTAVFGGETLWWTSNLPAGLTRIQVAATGGAPLSYELNVYATPTVTSGSGASWGGTSLGKSANNTEVRFHTTAAGLFTFAYGVNLGRYQFTVASDSFLQKTVEAPGSVTAYLAAGEHTLTVIQDSDEATTNWGPLTVTYAGAHPDALPYQRAGGQLGGPNNDFNTEWLPIFAGSSTPVNVRFALTGDMSDGMEIAIVPGGAVGMGHHATHTVYGGEIYWWTQDLATGLNQIRLWAQDGNTGPLSYEMTIETINTPTASWNGVAKGGAGNSVVRLNVPSSGTYQVTLDTLSGFAQVAVDQQAGVAQLSAMPTGQMGQFDIPLTAGYHTFTILQKASEPVTEWELEVKSVTAGDQIGWFSGTLAADETINPLLPVIGQAQKGINFKLQVDEVVGDGDLNLTITDSNGADIFEGKALDGETLWGTALLTEGNNTFTLQNGGVELSYELTLYELTGTTFSWDGVSDADGDWDSHVQVHFPSSGLYDFTYGLTEGRFQFTVGEDRIRKTAESPGSVRYYVQAGTHRVTVTPDRGADTVWDMAITATGIVADPLPYEKSGGLLDDTTFNTEWLPLYLDSGRPTNFVLTLTGTGTVDAYLYAGSDPDPVVTRIHAGERLWWTTDLDGGLNRVKLLATGGSSDLEYELEVMAQPTLAADWTWDGVSSDGGINSMLGFQVTTPGLYDLDFVAAAGSYQALLTTSGKETARRTVTADGNVRIYLAAGTHTLTLTQDTVTGAEWSLAITSADSELDTLPYTQTGGELGGAGNAFLEDLLPMRVAGGAPANFELTVNGQAGDTLTVHMYSDIDDIGNSPDFVSDVVLGGETVWWTAGVAEGMNWVRVLVPSDNSDSLSYELTIHPVPTTATAFSWGGLSRGTGMNSHVWLNTPAPGTYRVEMAVSDGFAYLAIEDASPGIRLMSGAYMAYDVQLEEGMYRFTTMQSTARLVNTWVATVTLTTTPAPALTGVSPDTIVNDADRTITLTGSNFWADAEVKLGTLVMANVTRTDSTTLSVVVPAGTAPGLYDITVTNPDDQSATLTGALTVVLPAPVLTGIAPAQVSNAANSTVTLTGSFFQTGASVRLNTLTMGGITVLNAGSLSFVVPAGTAAGVYDVTVTNPDGQSATLTGALTVTSETVQTRHFVFLPLVVNRAP